MTRGSRLRRLGQFVILATVCGCVVAFASAKPRAPRAARPPADTDASAPAVYPPLRRGGTIVSLEFDHALSDALVGVQLANSFGMKVTLFAMSGRIGLDTYMTVSQLQTLQAQGNEIGGHTVNHEDLSHLPAATQRWEICSDRAALEADGFNVTDFAYPYGHFNSATPGIVRRCGYESARGAGGLTSKGGCWGPCPPVESIPPQDRFDTWAINSVLTGTSLATIEHYVTRAERDGGGWVQIVFHYVCDACDTYSVRYATLLRLIPWLASQSKLGVREETVHQALNSRFDPPTITVRTGTRLTPRSRLTRLTRTIRLTAAAPQGRPPLLHAAGDSLIVDAGASVTSVRLALSERAAKVVRWATQRGSQWTIALPSSTSGGRGILTVTFALGKVAYPLRVQGAKG